MTLLILFGCCGVVTKADVVDDPRLISKWSGHSFGQFILQVQYFVSYLLMTKTRSFFVVYTSIFDMNTQIIGSNSH